MQPSTHECKHVPTETRATLQWPHMKACGNWTHEFMHREPLLLSCEFTSKRKESPICWTINSHSTLFLYTAHLIKNNSVISVFFLIVPSFPHTLHTYQHVSLFSVSTSETEWRPQLHVLLHFPWRHDLTQGQLCFAAWTQIVAPHAVCEST